MPFYHMPVMPKEVAEAMRLKPGGIYVDGTVGGGGHALDILERIAPDGVLIGIDLDDEALASSAERLKPFGTRKILVKGNFADIDAILGGLGITQVDGILFDLGVSSHQLDTADRGFSFSLDARLDMRMDRNGRLNAYDLVNTLPPHDLEKIIREYGEEMMAGRIAKAVAQRRKTAPIQTTAELANLVFQVSPPAIRRKRIHPATKTFQAIRIAVNDELLSLHKGINQGIDVLKQGGRFSIISFHSLEDRMVKDAFRSWEKGCICPPGFPFCTCNRKPKLRIVNKKPITADDREIESNYRSRSAKLRIAERV
ncbi:MAG: 16S rRNA (cytosine(1402)-N(4))-methyltransferase RsmH [Deltaproteobacteria bacterium]|nr:16S rRNA (cytosine(1402)-N(4))-methyltransferase RsmH [Deltaproteobacteria bacterium]